MKSDTPRPVSGTSKLVIAICTISFILFLIAIAINPDSEDDIQEDVSSSVVCEQGDLRCFLDHPEQLTIPTLDPYCRDLEYDIKFLRIYASTDSESAVEYYKKLLWFKQRGCEWSSLSITTN